jgi:hypothetical protein
MQVRHWISIFIVIASPVSAGNEEDERLKEATTTLTELASGGDKGIPLDLLNKAVCAVWYRGLRKAGSSLAPSTAGVSLHAGMPRVDGQLRRACA